MAYAAPARGYTVEDLVWLRDELGIAHLELDPWGSLIVSPATDEHESAVAVLHDQAVRQLGLPAGCVRSNGLAWKAPGGSGYVNSPTWLWLLRAGHRPWTFTSTRRCCNELWHATRHYRAFFTSITPVIGRGTRRHTTPMVGSRGSSGRRRHA